MALTVVYAREEGPATIAESMFLIGPTPRENGAHSWRTDAICLLEERGYDGVVFVPESRPDELGNTRFEVDYLEQVTWEQTHRRMRPNPKKLVVFIPLLLGIPLSSL